MNKEPTSSVLLWSGMQIMRKYQLYKSIALFCVAGYIVAFVTFMGIISSSPLTWVENTDLVKLEWIPKSDIKSNGSNPVANIMRMFWAPPRVNDTQLEQQHRNMTLLKANMSGVDAIVKHIKKAWNFGASLAMKGMTVKPVNPHSFEYLINCPDLCRKVEGDMLFVAYVHSAVDHYKRRMVIRQTWGNPQIYNGINMRLVFVMGTQVPSSKTNTSKVQDALYFEAEQYGDIVQENFLDTYHNLTYKGIAALKWISTYCSKPKFVVKTDDDIFVNAFMLATRLQRLSKKKMDHDSLMCLVWKNMVVMRTGKWKVEESEWKEKTYPTYCSGSAFIMSTDIAVRLHDISYHVPFFWVDDFYITGLLPLKLGNVTHTQISSAYVLNGKLLEEKFTGPQWYQYLFSHVHNLNTIMNVWQRMLPIAKGLSRPPIQFAKAGQLPDVPHKIDP